MGNFQLLFSGIYEGLAAFGKIVSNIVNFFLLLIVFVFGIGLVSVVGKLRGKKFLSLGFNSKAKSYWGESPALNRKLEDYLKPF